MFSVWGFPLFSKETCLFRGATLLQTKNPTVTMLVLLRYRFFSTSNSTFICVFSFTGWSNKTVPLIESKDDAYQLSTFDNFLAFSAFFDRQKFRQIRRTKVHVYYKSTTLWQQPTGRTYAITCIWKLCKRGGRTVDLLPFTNSDCDFLNTETESASSVNLCMKRRDWCTSYSLHCVSK